MNQNPIKELVVNYKENKLDRYEYIDKMHFFNKSLFYISERLADTDIKKIEIEDHSLIFTTRRDNIKLVFSGVDRRGVPFDILNFQHYEKEDEDILFQILNEDDVIFDIGANIGWYSLLFSKRLSNSTIYSFEPITETYNYLIKNISLNVTRNVFPFNFGLSDSIRDSTYYFFPGGSVLASERNLIGCPKAKGLVCKTSTLDQFVSDQKIKKMDFIKCDVEGAELFVIKGGLNSIKKFLPVIFIELFELWTVQFDYHPNDVIQLLNELDYQCFIATGDKLEICTEYKKTKDERLNFFFLHINKHKTLIEKLSS